MVYDADGYKGANLYYTQPVATGKTIGAICSGYNYNYQVHALFIDNAIIIYADDTKETVKINLIYHDEFYIG